VDTACHQEQALQPLSSVRTYQLTRAHMYGPSTGVVGRFPICSARMNQPGRGGSLNAAFSTRIGRLTSGGSTGYEWDPNRSEACPWRDEAEMKGADGDSMHCASSKAAAFARLWVSCSRRLQDVLTRSMMGVRSVACSQTLVALA